MMSFTEYEDWLDEGLAYDDLPESKRQNKFWLFPKKY